MATHDLYKIYDTPEKLQLICRKCNHKWIEERPKGYYVRHDNKGNFLINAKNPNDKKFFKCPQCNERRNIGRLTIKVIRT